MKKLILILSLFNLFFCYSADIEVNKQDDLNIENKFKKLGFTYNNTLQNGKLLKYVITPNGKQIFYFKQAVPDSIDFDSWDFENNSCCPFSSCSYSASSSETIELIDDVTFLDASNEYCVYLLNGFFELYDIVNKSLTTLNKEYYLGKDDVKFLKVINNFLIIINKNNVLNIFDLSKVSENRVSIESNSDSSEFKLKFNENRILVEFDKIKIGYDFNRAFVYKERGPDLDDRCGYYLNESLNSNYIMQESDQSHELYKYKTNLIDFPRFEQMIELSSLIHEVRFGDGYLSISFKNFESFKNKQQNLLTTILNNNFGEEVLLEQSMVNILDSLPFTLQRSLKLKYEIKKATEQVSKEITKKNDSSLLQVFNKNKKIIASAIAIGTLIYFGIQKYQKYLKK